MIHPMVYLRSRRVYELFMRMGHSEKKAQRAARVYVRRETKRIQDLKR